MMISNPYLITDDAQLYEAARALSGNINLEKIVEILAKTNPVLYPQVYTLIEDKIGKKKAITLFAHAEKIIQAL
ncbi:MAG: hypothetical protein JW812_02935 [Alphaproteobacteria bacterium]|nr:hypothetical protein [Alphaproteobacteria bacterium]MBN2779511.1 hypothetical protein [Alphaproteobacteria bacterium]